MSERTIPQPQFPDDDGTADVAVRRALSDYAEGRAGEHAVLSVLAGARLFVPVVAVLTEDETVDGVRREKESDMALPKLVGDDGRSGVLAFTSAESLARWSPDARPVAVSACQACQAALDESADAVVVDVAGPVPYAIEGARLQVLAADGEINAPHEDPEVQAAVHAAVGDLPGVDAIQVVQGTENDLAVRLRLADDADLEAVLREAADRLTAHLSGRVVGAVEIGLVRA